MNLADLFVKICCNPPYPLDSSIAAALVESPFCMIPKLLDKATGCIWLDPRQLKANVSGRDSHMFSLVLICSASP
jgi:hypothetical protein